MPTFNYKCKTCDNKWDFFAKERSEKPSICPSCGEQDSAKIIREFSFMTKNSEQAFRPYEKGEKLNEFIKDAKESLSEFRQEKMTTE